MIIKIRKLIFYFLKIRFGHWIVAYKRVNFLEEYVKNKGDLTLKNKTDMTPLDLAKNAIKNHDSSFIDIKNAVLKHVK